MFQYFSDKPKTTILAIVFIVSIAFNGYASKILNESYAESEFPVPYFEAQLSFDAERIKYWYAFLLENETFDIYVQTQHIDFIFILSILLLHASCLLLLGRAFKAQTKGRSILVFCALLSTIAPLADALENGVSYIMLANPSGFPNVLAMIYSSFAVIKFTFFTITYVIAAGTVLLIAFIWLRDLIFKKNSSPA